MPALIFILLAILFPLMGCSPETARAEGNATVNDWLPLKIGGVELKAQVALSGEEQRKGLMNRDSIPEDGGMLFPYARPQQLSFWMANTKIPLDIGFFDGTGLLLEVHRMIPFDTNKTRSRSSDVQYALEMNAGWFSANGLFPGQRMDMQALARALRQRGVDPALLGIDEAE